MEKSGLIHFKIFMDLLNIHALSSITQKLNTGCLQIYLE